MSFYIPTPSPCKHCGKQPAFITGMTLEPYYTCVNKDCSPDYDDIALKKWDDKNKPSPVENPEIGEGKIWNGVEWMKVAPGMEAIAMVRMAKELQELRREFDKMHIRLERLDEK